MSDGMGRELAYLSSHATNRYFIPNWGKIVFGKVNPKYGMNFFFMGSDKKKLAKFLSIRLNY